MRILGVDLGSSSIKSVEMESAFGRFDIRDYQEEVIQPGETQIDALNRLVRSLSKAPDKVILALPTSCNTFRNLTLPTRDRKAIQSGIGFELEDELPFSIEDSCLQYVILNQSKQGSSIHVAISLKQHLQALLDKLKDSAINPDIITTEEWAYRAMLNRLLGPNAVHQENPILLSIVGHERTISYLHWKGAPALIREFRWGGRNITEALSEKYQIPWDEAERTKLGHAVLYSSEQTQELSEEQLEMSSCIEAACEPLLVELRQCDLVARTVVKTGVSQIYLSGGTSLLPGLGSWLEDKLKVPVRPLLSLSVATTSGVTYSEQTDARFLLAASLALTLVGPERNFSLNFRKDEFSKAQRTRNFELKTFRKPLMAVGTVAATLALSLIVQSAVYKTRMEKTNTELEKAIRVFFGQISSSSVRNYLNNSTVLRNSINKELGKQRELSRLLGPNPNSPVDFLNTLSTTISKGIVVDMTEFKAGIPITDSYLSSDHPSEASIAFLVSNPQVAEKLTLLIKGKLGSFERGKMEEATSSSPGTQGSAQKWKISFSGKPNETSYAK